MVYLIKKVLESNCTTEEMLWMDTVITSSQQNERLLQLAFVTVPKYIQKSHIALDKNMEKQFSDTVRFLPEGWTLHTFARVYILLHFKTDDEKKYVNVLKTLFETAEMNELASLNSSLSLLHYPENWLEYAKEGVRSNMGPVFDAIVFNNPYPAKYFDEEAWNQMVLKTIFSGKSIQKIKGLIERSNPRLAFMISDFAHERWAAGRTISPQVWALVAPFIDNQLIKDIEKLFLSENKQDQKGAKLSCMHSDFAPAKDLLKKYKTNFTTENIEWANL